MPDAYQIKAYKITNQGLDAEEIANYEDVYFSQN
jgi:hypothetical protein